MRKLVPFALVVGVLAGCGGNGGSPLAIPETKTLTVVAGAAESGSADGPIATASFNNPVNVAVAKDGTVYVVEYDGSRIRRIRDGVVSTVVSQENFQRPFGITISDSGTVYVQTDGNDRGERDSTTGTVWRVDTVAGGATVVARDLGRPRGLATTADGTIVMANLTRNVIQTLNPTTGAVGFVAGSDGFAGFANGKGTTALFDRPYGLTRDTDGSFLVADQNNNRIRRVKLDGTVTTFAGTGVAGAKNGALDEATFNGPQDIKRVGNMYFVADTTGHLIREIREDYVITFAGNGDRDFVDALGVNASFYGLEGIAPTPDGRFLYVADGTGGEDTSFHRVRVFAL